MGTPFSAAHTFLQTGPFRPRNLVHGVSNVVLVGCGTTPGIGVPTVLLSGKLAAFRITGLRPATGATGPTRRALRPAPVQGRHRMPAGKRTPRGSATRPCAPRTPGAGR